MIEICSLPPNNLLRYILKKSHWPRFFFTGTETDFFAGHRACKCLMGFYRTHLFKKCHKCGHGLECKDDHDSLKSGYWWKWRNKKHRDRYRNVLANLLASSPALDTFRVQYPYPIPTPYRCPMEESCKV